MNQPLIELTEAEWAIIKAVWEREPCTAPAVQEAVFAETRWTYSTARTLMDRMVGKGLLKAEKQGKMTSYRSAVTREQAQRGEGACARPDQLVTLLRPHTAVARKHPRGTGVGTVGGDARDAARLVSEAEVESPLLSPVTCCIAETGPSLMNETM